MKTIYYIKFLSKTIGLLLITFLFKSCQSDNIGTENDSHQHSETEKGSSGHEDMSLEKTVELTVKQYELTDIKFGDFQMKNMSEVLNVNGYTKLPPHNQADVSVHIGGLIKSIKVLEGQYVKKGQTVAAMESPEFAKLHQAYLSSKSKIEYLKADFERQTELQNNEVNAKKVVQKVKSDLEIEEAKFNALSQQLKLFNINPNGQISTVVPIRAPISGHLTEVHIKIGSAVTPNTPLFSIVDNSEMHIDLLVYEKDLYKVKEGQGLRFVLTNQSHTEINGTIFNIGKSFENETKSVAVHAHINNHDVDLIPGMYINALIDVGSNKVETLPSSAIIDDLGRQYIFVLETNEPIHTGHGHEEESHTSHNHGAETSHEEHDDVTTGNHSSHEHETTNSHSGHNHGAEEKADEHANSHDAHTKHFDFRRVEVKTGAEQLGSIEVQLMGKLKQSDKIVIDGSFYLQSHLQKNEGNGGGHHH